MRIFSDVMLNRILEKLQISRSLPVTQQALQDLYSNWCMNVPFDNLRKMIVLRKGVDYPLPGLDPADFFENWLSDGCGATCWPISNALFELLSGLGFNARRIAGSMRDMGIINHATIGVIVDDQDWLVDASLMFNRLVPMDGNTFISGDTIVPAEIETDGDSYLLWLSAPPGPDFFCCRIFMQPRDISFYAEGYEKSITFIR